MRLPDIVYCTVFGSKIPQKWNPSELHSTDSQRAWWTYAARVIDIPDEHMIVSAQPRCQSLGQENISLWVTEIIFNIHLSLEKQIQSAQMHAHTHLGVVLHRLMKNVRVGSVQRLSIKYVLHNAWKMSRLDSTHGLTLFPSICLLSLVYHTLSFDTHTHTNKHTSTELWMNSVTLWWYICHIYTKSSFKGLSLFMLPRVHILSLDIYREAYDGPKHWCLTAADTESRLHGHRHRQHLRAWNTARRRLHIRAEFLGPTEQFFLQRETQCCQNRCT